MRAEFCEEVAAPSDVSSQYLWRGVKGKLLARDGAYDEGIALATSGVHLTRTSDDIETQGNALVFLAEAQAAAGRADDAAAPRARHAPYSRPRGTSCQRPGRTRSPRLRDGHSAKVRGTGRSPVEHDDESARADGPIRSAPSVGGRDATLLQDAAGVRSACLRSCPPKAHDPCLAGAGYAALREPAEYDRDRPARPEMVMAAAGDAIRVEIYDPDHEPDRRHGRGRDPHLGSNAKRGKLVGGVANAVGGVATFPDLSIDTPGLVLARGQQPGDLGHLDL